MRARMGVCRCVRARMNVLQVCARTHECAAGVSPACMCASAASRVRVRVVICPNQSIVSRANSECAEQMVNVQCSERTWVCASVLHASVHVNVVHACVNVLCVLHV